MSSKFLAVNWSPNEVLAERKTDQMADNADWLYRNTPRALYTSPGGIRRTEGVKIASGRILVTKRKSDIASVTVRFSGFFVTGCQPNITTGVVSDGQSRVFCTINGIGTLLPDNRGFRAKINVAAENKRNDRIARSMYVTWNAMGY